MFTKSELFFIFAETPLHCGSGSTVGTIDLPIQREVYNELPIIHGQSLKGAIRDFFENNYKNSNEEKEKIEITFGPNNTEYASCLSFSQANLLLFPIPSFKGVFAYATSPMCLDKFFRTLKMLYPETKTPDYDKLKNYLINENKVLIPSNSSLHLNNKVILANLVFEKESIEEVDKLALFLGERIFKKEDNYNFLKNILSKNIVILNDTVFSKLTKLKTDVVYRNKIGENGIVEEGALWTEEYLPSDTIMWSTIFVGQPKKENSPLKTDIDVLKFVKENLKTLFIGGNKTIGKGLVSIHFCEVQNEQK